MKRVAIIGGGPSGIVTLKYLLESERSLGCEPVEVRLFEYQHNIGGTFLTRTYEDAELVSSKQLTTFSDFRAKQKNQDFLKAVQYRQYLDDYCTHFNLWPHINLQIRVIAVRKRPRGGHLVTYRPEKKKQGSSEADIEPEVKWECDAVAVCSGLHVEPNIPYIPGLERVPEVLHSSQFKTRSQFGEGKTVVVVGTGETGADVAHLAITSPTKRVLLCHREGFHIAPKRNPGPVLFPVLGRKQDPNEPGIPIDVSRTNLFDTTYVHPILRNSMVLWHYYHAYILSLLWVCAGSTYGMGQWVGEMPPERHHPAKTVFFNKTAMKICPHLAEPYREENESRWIYRIRSALAQTPLGDSGGKVIDLAPWPKGISSDGTLQLCNSGRPEWERLKNDKVKPDIIVFATGYSQSFPFFQKAKGDKAQREYPLPEEADVRNVWKRDEPTIGFIGFLRPGLGAIPPLAEMQAQLWVYNLMAGDPLSSRLRPEDEPHYRLMPPPGARILYGVDHESYVYQLAMDMDAAPGVTDVLRICVRGTKTRYAAGVGASVAEWLRMPIVWALGANFVTKFRLMGPWAWDGAMGMMASEEFWETITRRPFLFGHILVNLLPICIFGPMSFVVWCCDIVARTLAWFIHLFLGAHSPGSPRTDH